MWIQIRLIFIVPNKIHPYNPDLKILARKLRKNMTLGEVLLWQKVRDRQLGFQFHRQVPLYRYIVDFYCHELQLAIEIDGSSHNHPDIAIKDLSRQEELEKHGIHFLRFEEKEIRRSINDVLDVIERWIECNAY
jgi:very-short-patch-repair endonuclease